MHSALTVILVKYYTITNPTQKGLDKMISIIQDKDRIETDEEFDERVSNYLDCRRIAQEVRERREQKTKRAAASHYNKIAKSTGWRFTTPLIYFRISA